MNKEEAIKILRELHDKVLFSERTALETLHPELKESEDEKIRKELINFFQDWHKIKPSRLSVNVSDILAWLEKQGAEMKTIRESLGFTTQEECDEYNQMVSDLIMSDNKVKPKFHEGEWVVFNDKHESVYQIEKIENFQYTLRHILGGSMPLSFSGEDMIRPWTIQDAKDGDVLCYKDEISLYKHDIKNCTKQETTFGGFVYHCCYDGKRFITDSLYSLTEQDKMDIHPATKEQRDLLFQKTKEAGYTFDFEKKELKKIEQPELTEFEEAVKDMIDDYRDAIDAHAATTEEVKERAAYMLSLIPHKSAEWSEEDEKIRKTLKYYLEVRRCQTQSDEEYINCNNFLAWLEKQGEEDSSIQQAYEWGYTEGKRIERKHWVEKQKFSEDYNSIDPQFGKPINKVEPKFKVGDWCIDNEDGTIFQIVKVLDNTYTYKTNEGKEYSCSHYSLENDAHLWTIQDARLGDVLACNEEILLFKSYSVQGRISLYCWYNGQTNNFHSKEVVDTLMTTRNKIYPATKEQRNTLFAKMKEAGYEWDAEKKELKKIEQKSVGEEIVEALRTEYEKGRADAFAQMQKEWSKEDESIALGIEQIVNCASLLNIAPDKLNKVRDWLKCIKDRVYPKQEWKQENTDDLTDFENAMMHIGESFFGNNAGLDPNDIDAIKEQANTLLGLVPSKEWSEEDEKMLNSIIEDFGDGKTSNMLQEYWLKSIKERYTWKPSDEQMIALEYIINNAHNTSYSCKIAKELLEQLRKLKGE